MLLPCLALRPLGIKLWLFELDDGSNSDASWLSEEEHARAQRFVFEQDRQRYLAAHAALRRVLHQEAGFAPGVPFTMLPHGKPCLGTAHRTRFNLSHSVGWGLVGCSSEHEIGVDIEVDRTMPDADELGRDYFQPEELAELRRRAGADSLATMLLCGWTRKEACLKALGTGLSLSPTCFATGLLPDARRVLMPSDSGQVAVEVVSLDLGPHLVAAAATTSLTSATAQT